MKSCVSLLSQLHSSPATHPAALILTPTTTNIRICWIWKNSVQYLKTETKQKETSSIEVSGDIHIPHRQCNATLFPHDVCTHCTCRQSDPALEYVVLPACRAWTTWIGVVRRTPSAYLWLKWGRHLAHPSDHSSVMDQGPQWEAEC